MDESNDPETRTAHLKSLKPDQTFVYKKTKKTSLKLHVFNPSRHSSTLNRPAIVFFFGGGWINGSHEQFFPHCHRLSTRGIVAISAEYRVEARHQTTPQESLKDAKSAVRWIRSNAQTLGIDPEKIIAGGGSAGGHLAAASALSTGFDEDSEDTSVSCRPCALVLFNPVIDNGPGGYGHDRVKAYWEQFSTLHTINETAPPSILFLGTEDALIPVSAVEEYKRRMDHHGRRCDLHLYEGQAHGFFNYQHRENFEQTMKETETFLASLGYL